MRFLNIEITVLKSAEFLGQEPVDRATWLCLQTYCTLMETGGVVTGCGQWGDRKWQQVVGITKEEAHRACPLWQWEGDSIILWGYNHFEEERIKTLRSRASEAGKSSGARRSNQTVQPDGSTEPLNETVQPKGNRTDERTERKGKEKNEKKENAQGRAPESFSSNGKPPDGILLLANGKPLGPEYLPIAKVLRDDEDVQDWVDSAGERWTRTGKEPQSRGPYPG